MKLISKLKKISICSLLSVGTLMSAGSIGLSATHPEMVASREVLKRLKRNNGYKVLDEDPILVYVSDKIDPSTGKTVVFMPQCVIEPETEKRTLVYVAEKAKLIGRFIPAYGYDRIKLGRPVVAYLTQKVGKPSRNTSTLLIPQVVNFPEGSEIVYSATVAKMKGNPVFTFDAQKSLGYSFE
ncbi:MAG: hypothetical protein Q4B93_01775 [Clostridia bacterium]|nr:hypothetical protein [Clostridia bacterium]